MPELPEVETTRRGIEPLVRGRTVRAVQVREARLRYGVPPQMAAELPGRRVEAVTRRGKYLLLHTGDATLIIHLGMSGTLRRVPAGTPADKHDHVDICFTDGYCLRLRDPRRFGCLVWVHGAPAQHPLLRELGPEPLGEEFNGRYLFERSRGRKVAIKQFIMDSRVVAGVGNIYVNEALFEAGIHPLRAAGRVSAARYELLAQAIRHVLQKAIAAGGTTLRDFVNGAGAPGYFQQQLQVYGRVGEKCLRCGTTVRHLQSGQRATYFCPRCQR